MKLIINNKEYEIKTNLYTVKKIQSEFKKPFLTVVEGVGNLMIDDLIKLLNCGYNGDDLSDAIYQNWGLAEVYEAIEDFLTGIQYGGLTKAQREAKEKENLEKYKKAKEAGLIK